MYLPHQITVLELSIALASRISTSNLSLINTFFRKRIRYRVKTNRYITPIDLQTRLDLYPQVIQTKECNDTTLFSDDVDVIWTLPVAVNEFQVLNDYEFLASLTSWDGSLRYPHLILSSDGTISRRSTERIIY